jgi:hypothetical protein
LEKDVEERYQSAKEIARQLKRLKRESGRQRVSRISAIKISEALKPAEDFKGTKLSWLVAALCLLGFIAALALLYLHPALTTPPTIRAFIHPPENTRIGEFALSPDGSTLAFIAFDSVKKESQLWIRPLNALTAQPLAGTEKAWSPYNAP